MLIKVHNPSIKKKFKKNGVIKMKKKRRSPAQVRATKKLIAYNKAKRRKKNPAIMSVIKRKKRSNPMVMTKRIKRRPRRSMNEPITRYVYKYAYKRRKKNPAGVNFLDIIQSSVLAGIGGMSVLAISNMLSNMIDIKTDKQKSLIRLITSLLFGYVTPRMMRKDQSDALFSGAMAITWVSFIKTIMPVNAQNYFMLGDSVNTKVDRLVDSIMGSYDSVLKRTSPELKLLGESELGTADLGEYENQISPGRW